MRIFVIQILEYLEQYKSDTNCKQEEQKSRNYYTSWIGIRIFKSDDKSKYNNTNDIIDNSGTHDCCADFTFQFSQFFQRLHSNTYTGSRHNDTNKYSFIEFLRAPGCHSVKSHVQQCSSYQRNKYTKACDQKCHKSRLHEIPQIRLQSGGEHQQDNTDFCHLDQKIRLLHQAQYTGSDQQTGNDLTYHLWCLTFSRNDTKHLGKYNNDCQISENTIRFHFSYPSFSFKLLHYNFTNSCYCILHPALQDIRSLVSL